MTAIDAWLEEAGSPFLVAAAIVCPRSGVCLLWCSAIWSPKPPAVHLTVPLPSVLVTRQGRPCKYPNKSTPQYVGCPSVGQSWMTHVTHVDKARRVGWARPFWRSTPPTPLSRQGHPPPLEACINIFVQCRRKYIKICVRIHIHWYINTAVKMFFF